MTADQTMVCESESDSGNLTLMDKMLDKERTTYAQHDYFARTLPVSPIPLDVNGAFNMPVDKGCRNIMTKWCMSICKFCSYDPLMVTSVMSCVDRFVATKRGSSILLDRNQYQLAVMTSMYLVAKIQQTQALEPESIAKLSRGKYTKADIESMELEMLVSLNWFVNPPTPMAFAHEFLANFDFVPKDCDDVYVSENESTGLSCRISTEERIMELVKCQIQEATYDYELSCLTRPSHVAFGALCNALETLDIVCTELDAMKILKERLQIIDGVQVSESLLRVISSSESSNDSLSSLLLNRCNGSGKSSRRNSHSSQSSERTASFASLSSVHFSPRTVAADI